MTNLTVNDFNVYGMKAWKTEIAFKIHQEQSFHKDGVSSTEMLNQCVKLASDDTGGVGIIESMLANEVLFLNSQKYDVEIKPQLSMSFFLKQLGSEYADESSLTKLKSALLEYFESHECADDKNFQDWKKELTHECS